MKKLILIVAILFVSISAASAQSYGYFFVNSENIFKSQSAYNTAIAQLDELTKQYQKNIDDAYKQIETLYNNYQAQKNYLSESSRSARESDIINREKEVAKYQEDIFGQDGDLMKKRIEIIKPIQDKVFAAITQYAKTNNLGMVIDVVNNQTLLYSSPALDKTNEIINSIK